MTHSTWHTTRSTASPGTEWSTCVSILRWIRIYNGIFLLNVNDMNIRAADCLPTVYMGGGSSSVDRVRKQTQGSLVPPGYTLSCSWTRHRTNVFCLSAVQQLWIPMGTIKVCCCCYCYHVVFLTVWTLTTPWLLHLKSTYGVKTMKTVCLLVSTWLATVFAFSASIIINENKLFLEKCQDNSK